jgi:hypothetical protein
MRQAWGCASSYGRHKGFVVTSELEGSRCRGMFYGGTRLLIVVGRLCVTKRWRSRGQVDDKPSLRAAGSWGLTLVKATCSRGLRDKALRTETENERGEAEPAPRRYSHTHGILLLVLCGSWVQFESGRTKDGKGRERFEGILPPFLAKACVVEDGSYSGSTGSMQDAATLKRRLHYSTCRQATPVAALQPVCGAQGREGASARRFLRARDDGRLARRIGLVVGGCLGAVV